MQKKPPFINIVITALLALLTVLSSFLGSVTSNNLNNFPIKLPPAIMSYLQSAWPWLLVVTIAYIGLSIWQAVRQPTGGDIAPLPRSQRQQRLIEKQNRQRMLDRVHTFWIKGVLEQSLHGAALIALGLHEQPDAIENPWHLILQQPDQPEHPLLPGTRITQVYDDAGGELLILGDPGSGKTTLLLELARDLLDRAQKDDAYPMPVVFNLSSWAVKRQPLAAWLASGIILLAALGGSSIGYISLYFTYDTVYIYTNGLVYLNWHRSGVAHWEEIDRIDLQRGDDESSPTGPPEAQLVSPL